MAAKNPDRGDGLCSAASRRRSRRSTSWRANAASASPRIPRHRQHSAGFALLRRARTGRVLKDADLGLLLDVDVPWIPNDNPKAQDIRWIQIDVDPMKTEIPIWGFATDLRFQADCTTVLRQVLDGPAPRRRRIQGTRQGPHRVLGASAASAAQAPGRCGGKAGRRHDGRACLRRAQRQAHRRRHHRQRGGHQRPCRAGPVTPHQARNLFRAWRRRPRRQRRHGARHQAGAAGGRVVQIAGDGVFHFSNPDAVYAVAQQFNLPIFTLVLDNGGWRAVKSSVLRVYPKGTAAEIGSFQAKLHSGRQGEIRRFDQVASAFGAHGENVTIRGGAAGGDRALPQGRQGRPRRRARRRRDAALGGAGRGSGIRTHVRVSPKHAFQACAFNRSATPPRRGAEPIEAKGCAQPGPVPRGSASGDLGIGLGRAVGVGSTGSAL